jgi:hypothetical protein
MWTDPVLRTVRNYNIGTLCTDMVVVDIDVKEGKDGLNEYTALAGHYDTLVVQTPTGGFHCYFNGPDSSNAPVSKSVDIRSHNGYVVAPGSTINGVPYKVVRDADLAWIPLSIERLLKPPYVRAETDYNQELDNAASVENARRFLESAPVAVQGQRGDETTFVTAARLVREMALSTQTAFALMRDHWNERCSPPWALEELYAKVENAAAYGSAGLGTLTPEQLFGHIHIEPPPSIFEQSNAAWGNAFHPYQIKPRPWIVNRMLMAGAVTLLLAAGSAGKSSMSLALAAHLALGKDFGDYKTERACKSIIYNGEDDLEEQSRRLLAVCMVYGFDFNEVKKHIMLLSRHEVRINLAHCEYDKPIANDIVVTHLTNLASDHDVGLLILDPLVNVHQCDESDNGQMAFVMETITDLAAKAKIAVMVLHHTAKSVTRQEDRIGNMDVSRGASSIVNAARIAFTLLNASQQDAEEYGMQDEERNTWVRLDDAKMNLTLANRDATWMRKEGIKISSGDVVGVTKIEKLERSHQHIRIKIARLLIATLEANGGGAMTMPQVIAVVKNGEPLWANKTDADIRKRVEGMFSTTVEIEGRRLKVIRNPDDKDSKPILTLS